eukprot:snap_masked-scaffold_14-processed-gene-6.32-mRNA-1 protein AED:1.00 eAED:1.00 QI:0/0/0/0/1/1/2/0/166
MLQDKKLDLVIVIIHFITGVETISSSDASAFFNQPAQEIYDNINIDARIVGDIFAYSQAIKESLAMIQFIEISIAWVYVSFSGSTVLRKKSQDKKKQVIFLIRLFQISVGLIMFWYTVARFSSEGKIYSNFFFYVYGITAVLVGCLLFYVLLLFRGAILLDKMYKR